MPFLSPKYTSEKGQAISRFRSAGYHKPLVHYRYISLSGFLLLLIAFIIFLLVALSVPIIKTVYLLKVTALVNPNQPKTNIASVLKFGVWGVCATSVIDRPENFGECIGPQLGYTIPPNLIALTGLNPSIVDILLKALVVLLVLHPVAASLSFITFVHSLFLGSHGVSIMALLFAVITSLVSTVVFAIDLGLVLVAKSKVKDITVAHFEVAWGNAVWMVLTATILTWAAVFLLSARACYCCGVRRKDFTTPDSLEKDVTI